jgi:hypothetical protein
MTRRSFLLHIDSLDVLDELSNEQAGMLLKAMRDYHNEEEMQLDALTKIVFSPFKNQFNRDSIKYQTTCERRANAGSMGGKQKVANASKPKQKVANLAESVNVSKNVSKNDSDSDSDNVNDSKKIKDLPAIAEEYVFKLLTNKNDLFYLVTAKEIDYYKSTYQAVNIEQQFREIASWLNANNKNRKTINGMPKFINAWLSKAQNKAPRVNTSSAIGKTQEIFNQLSEINYDRR